MIRPTKYMDLDSCVLSVSAHILIELNKVGYVALDALTGTVEKRLGDAGRHNIPAALALLYVLGTIEYADDADSIVLEEHSGGLP